MTMPLRLALLGALLGLALGLVGFTSWDEVHAMFTFAEPRLFFSFLAAVALLTAAWPVLAFWLGMSWAPRLIHRGSVAGGLLFGCGWALTGACPTVGFVQLGEGRLLALFTIAGVVLGNLAFALLQGRVFKFATGPTCKAD